MKRRTFITNSVKQAGAITIAPPFIKNLLTDSPNERVNIAVVGISGYRERIRDMINGRGIDHVKYYSKMPNVRITTLCDVDERLFPGMVSEVEKLAGYTPKTEWDFRKLIEDPDLDAVSIATPDHWHALQTVWACQAGKDVLVEKPAHYCVSEGKKMIDAARKYNRVVQCAIHPRSSKATQEGVKFIREGKLGKVYMARGIVLKYRASIGHVEDSPIPEGVHWDTFLGPAPYRHFNENRYIYTWHWFWDTSTTEFGNNGVYRMDAARWAMNINTHPVEVHCTGGKYGRDDDQEIPNILTATYKYADGVIIQNEVRSLSANPEGINGQGRCFIYSDIGWMELFNGFRTYFGPNNEPGPSMSDDDIPEEEKSNIWQNFIDCVRTRRMEDLECDIAEGHMSTVLGHLGVVSYRTGRKLHFNPATESFINDEEANSYLTRNYRKPYSMPEKV